MFMPKNALRLGLALFWIASVSVFGLCDSRIQLTLDSSEADQVLAILAFRRDGKPVEEAAWQKLFATEPYQRLKQREKKIGEQFHEPTIAFSDDDFRKFVLSDDLLKRAGSLQSTLDQWKKTEVRELAERDLRYLPPEATIRATIYPIIKPRTNSFVWEGSTNPAIFLYLDPDVTREKFQNTVAHELHHIGLSSGEVAYEQKLSGLPENPRAVAVWIGSFGEGFAMLAAAGSPDVHPHAVSLPADRARWDRDMENFSTNLQSVNAFFFDVLNGKFASRDAVDEKGSEFFGTQGPWYTVGYKMAAMVEKRYGRSTLIETMQDPRRLLFLYNQVASEINGVGKEHLPLWSEEVLKQINAPSQLR
jgi:Putative zinc dependent peptidase (DUF5700)